MPTPSSSSAIYLYLNWQKGKNLILLSTFLAVLKLHKSNLASSGSSKMLSGNQSIKSNKIVFKFSDFVVFIPVTARQLQNDILISASNGYSLSR